MQKCVIIKRYLKYIICNSGDLKLIRKDKHDIIRKAEKLIQGGKYLNLNLKFKLWGKIPAKNRG